MITRKTVLWTLLSLVVIACLVLAVTLVPAHLQIREISVTVPTLETLPVTGTALTDQPVRVEIINTAQQTISLGTIGHPGVLISWQSGRQFLVDVGMDRNAAIEFGLLLESLFGADPTETFGPVHEQLGDAVNRIQGIGFTHLHIDHTQGITALCDAMNQPATVYQTRAQATEHNLHTREGHTLVTGASCPRQLVDADVPMPVAGFPGLFMIPAGGHTPGSTIFVAQMPDHIWVFSGDITNDMNSITSNQGKGVLYSYLIVPENTTLLTQWRVWLKAADDRQGVTVMPAHDIKRMQQYLYPQSIDRTSAGITQKP